METFAYLYDIFETCEVNSDNDLTISIAKFIADHPEKIDHGDQEKAYNRFIGKHYEDLVKAYQSKDRAAFDAKVAELVAADLEENK